MSHDYWTGNAMLSRSRNFLQSLLRQEVYPEMSDYTVTMAP